MPENDHSVLPRSAEEARALLKHWLLETMKRKNWSIDGWAKEAGVATTAIVRFLNSDDPDELLSADTLEKLAGAAR